MNCVFGEVKGLIRNGEVFDCEALFEEEMKDYIYEYSAEYVEQQHQQFDLECEVKEINKLTGDGEVFNNCFGEVFEESKQHQLNKIDCVFGKVKSLIINGKSYDELFGVDINLLNREQRKEFVNELLSMNENTERNLELSIEEHERMTRLENERLQHTKPNYYQLLKDMIKQDKEHKLFQYEYAQKLIPRDELLSHQKRYIRYFVKAHQNKHYEARDQYYEDLINMDTFI